MPARTDDNIVARNQINKSMQIANLHTQKLGTNWGLLKIALYFRRLGQHQVATEASTRERDQTGAKYLQLAPPPKPKRLSGKHAVSMELLVCTVTWE